MIFLDRQKKQHVRRPSVGGLSLCLGLWAGACLATQYDTYVSPAGDDRAAGTQAAPFRTLARAQQAARALTKDMRGDVVVNLAPGEYRLDRPLTFTAADSGRNGHRVIYRSAAGPGKARLLGSRPLRGWQPDQGGIWKITLPPKTVVHTLYENGQRVYKARFPNRESVPHMPTAAGRYLTTADGSPIQSDKVVERPKGPGWLTYRPDDGLPATGLTKMRLHIYARGKCDWVREIFPVTAIDRQACRITLASTPTFGIGAGARFFVEDERELLDAPGEFFVDEKAAMLYYKPLGKGHPDQLGITYPVLQRMIELGGTSRDACVENLVLDGLALEETDDRPPLPLWAYDGLRDGALVWMHNTAHVEVRNCHLKNSGRHGAMLIGHNVENLVTGCWIEHLGVNGVSLCNRFLAPNKTDPTADRCEHNRITNTRISHVGELHTYAECVTAFNVSHNEVDHCQLDNSVRYAITLRGNTGPQYGPPVSTNHPPTRGNRFHHIRVERCGQDGGDMGALHGANLNNPGGGCVNTFDQITVADTAAIPSMQDIGPNGIFLDWPRMAMDQVFRNLHIVRSQADAFRSHRPENGDSAQTDNVSWKPGFSEARMDYEHIGLTDEFPAEFGGRPPRPTAIPTPVGLHPEAAHDRVVLRWDPAAGRSQVEYVITRDGREVGRTRETQWSERRLHECTTYRYTVAGRCGDFAHFGPAGTCAVTTPADRISPTVTGTRLAPDGRHVRVAFSEAVDKNSACNVAAYRFEPPLKVLAAEPCGPGAVTLTVEGVQPKLTYQIRVQDVADVSAARNRMPAGKPMSVGRFDVTVRYPLDAAAGAKKLSQSFSPLTPGPSPARGEGSNETAYKRWEDVSGGGGDAVLHGGATLEAEVGPHRDVALVLDGTSGFAEGPRDLNLGPGDFTLCVWIYRERAGAVVSKGNGFGRPEQWSFGEPQSGVSGGAAMRIENHYFGTAARAVRDRQWTHLAFVRRGHEGRVYVNGLPSGGPHDLSGVGPLVNDRPLRIGRREYEPNPMYFQGKIAGLAIWPRALSAAQVLEEAGVPRGGQPGAGH
jgi:hypothetical protein